MNLRISPTLTYKVSKMEEKFVKISQLRPSRRGLNIRALVLEKGDIREGISRKTGMPYKFAEVLLGDDSGVVRATFWGDTVDSIELDKTYEFYNVATTIFRNALIVNVGNRSKIKLSETKIPREAINFSNNVSERKRRRERESR